MIDSLYYSSRGGVKTLLLITKLIKKSFVIHYERFEDLNGHNVAAKYGSSKPLNINGLIGTAN